MLRKVALIRCKGVGLLPVGRNSPGVKVDTQLRFVIRDHPLQKGTIFLVYQDRIGQQIYRAYAYRPTNYMELLKRFTPPDDVAGPVELFPSEFFFHIDSNQ